MWRPNNLRQGEPVKKEGGRRNRVMCFVIAELVRIDGDIDTIASIAGQIAGVRLGIGGLPASAVSLPCVQACLPAFERFLAVVVKADDSKRLR